MQYLVVIFLSILLTACASHDAQYYRLHPQALQAVLKNCPQNPPKSLTCEELVKIADEMNQLAYQLQIDPQSFGNRILSAQENLTRLKREFIKNKTQTHLRVQIAEEKQKIAEYLAVVRWLESPEK